MFAQHKVPPYIPEYCPFRLQTKQFYTFSQSPPASTLHPCHFTSWHPIIYTLTLQTPKPSHSAMSHHISHTLLKWPQSWATLNSTCITKLQLNVCNFIGSRQGGSVLFIGNFSFNRKRNIVELELRQDCTAKNTMKYAVSTLQQCLPWWRLLCVSVIYKFSDPLYVLCRTCQRKFNPLFKNMCLVQ